MAERSRPPEPPAPPSDSSTLRLACNRCGFEVPSRAWGCRNPCPNCGMIYPLGDCSD